MSRSIRLRGAFGPSRALRGGHRCRRRVRRAGHRPAGRCRAGPPGCGHRPRSRPVVGRRRDARRRGRERPDLPGPRGRAAHRAGAIYWHVANKSELLVAATDAVLTGAAEPGVAPEDAIRAVALGVYDAVEAHPWVGAQLSRRRPSGRPSGCSKASGGSSRRSACPSPSSSRGVGASELRPRGRRAERRVGWAGTGGHHRTAFLEGGSADLDPDDFAFTRTVAGSAARPRRPRAVPRRHRPHPGGHPLG